MRPNIAIDVKEQMMAFVIMPQSSKFPLAKQSRPDPLQQSALSVGAIYHLGFYVAYVAVVVAHASEATAFPRRTGQLGGVRRNPLRLVAG